LTQAPELFDSPLRARSLAYLFIAGALMGVLTLVLPHESSIDEVGLGATAGAAALVGIGLLAGARRAAMWQLHGVMATGTAMVALANDFVGATALYPLLFSWPILYAFSFLRRPAAIAHTALAALAYAIVLIVQDPSSAYVRWLLAIGSPAIAGVLISRLLDRVLEERIESQTRQRLLEQSEARTLIVLNSAPDPFVAIDREGLVRAWNAAAERKLGWPASEAIGKPFAELAIPPEQRDAHDERRRALLDPSERDATLVLEVELQARDGRRFPAEARVSKVTLGDEVFAAGFLRDVSDRERREAERAALLREQAARAEAERVAELVSGMQRLVDAALAHRTRHEILAELVTSVRDVVGADSAAIYVADGDSLPLGAASGGTPGGGGQASLAFGEGFAGRVAAAREPMLAHSDALESDDEGEEVDRVSMIGVPLLAGGEVTGVLVVCAGAPRRFSSDDFNLLRLAADRVALALDHAGLYERELKIAETLQRSLLPERLPKLPGLEVAARYLPAAAESEVGGDWYDVLPIPGGGIGLVMGDIAGKGLTAASMVGRLRSALRAYALEGHPPAEVVGGLNRLVWSEGQDGQMATLLFVVVDPAEGRIGWVNAGHPPPLLVSGEEAPRYLRGGSSVPLGVLPFPDFEEASEAVNPEATVVLYTDGLVERPGENLDLGLERLAELVRDAPQSPEALCDDLLRALVADGAPADDVALLALRTLPVSDRLHVEFASEPDSLASLRAVLRRWLRHVGASEDELGEIVTACGEAATNSIEHSGARAGSFEVSGRIDGRQVELSVCDRGAWRAPREGTQGRGLPLMRGLMDEVEVTSTARGTTVRMSRMLQHLRG
jgi:PAS domain S-box-containing protein